jgi:membrane protein YdbS with pleckstrin-like domain
LKFSGDVLLAIWLAWSLLLLRLVWKVISWSAEYCIVTSDRMIVIRGVLARDVAMIPFVRLIKIDYERSMLGRSFGYGSFVLEVDDQDMPVWELDFMPYPEQLLLEVISIVSRHLPDEADSE